ncbi:MAG: hypothetical protein COW54_14145 [Rhodobacteraceae bacterium CG17_big_fil_post_rev_8_21_14_2_50_63_15]|nr:hypothetical protein [Roseovarius sp.]PIV77478.1 MAG: hypothetical protein COW54_14145 [Rhodobacteraceae bacterium CG17_big_fil_post_rev_8_21_14_2_50_63_15]
MRSLFLMLASCLLGSAGAADEPDILDAAVRQPGTSWRVDVTVQHPDTGWDHYVDGWEVQDKDGNRLGYRLLHHPHVNEQPFTRSLEDLDLPEGTREIFIRAHCSVDGWSSEALRVSLGP